MFYILDFINSSYEFKDTNTNSDLIDSSFQY